MEDKDLRIGANIEKAIADLPEEKKQYFIGFAEGVAAMASQTKQAS